MIEGSLILTLPRRAMRGLIVGFLLAMLLLRAAPAALPVYDHVVIVIEENESFAQIIGNSATAPYINSLAQHGVVFTRMRGVRLRIPASQITWNCSPAEIRV